jgi:hypothetical protein
MCTKNGSDEVRARSIVLLTVSFRRFYRNQVTDHQLTVCVVKHITIRNVIAAMLLWVSC